MAIASSTLIVAYLALFAFAGLAFVAINMTIGIFFRPDDPHAEKLEIYECGEPTIGSSFVQFDLRFYVVALLFIIFDVEVAMFFPWATVFGKTTQLADADLPAVVLSDSSIRGPQLALTPAARSLQLEMGLRDPQVPGNFPATKAGAAAADKAVKDAARGLAWVSMFDILAFFAVLMVGFLYVWKRGDLDWVRAMQARAAATSAREWSARGDREVVLSI